MNETVSEWTPEEGIAYVAVAAAAAEEGVSPSTLHRRISTGRTDGREVWIGGRVYVPVPEGWGLACEVRPQIQRGVRVRGRGRGVIPRPRRRLEADEAQMSLDDYAEPMQADDVDAGSELEAGGVGAPATAPEVHRLVVEWVDGGRVRVHVRSSGGEIVAELSSASARDGVRQSIDAVIDDILREVTCG